MLKPSSILLGLTLSVTLAAAAVASLQDTPFTEVASPVVLPAQMDAATPNQLAATEPADRMQFDALEQNPFNARSWYVPPPAPAPVVSAIPQDPPKPVVPPLPFTYLGQMEDTPGHIVVYLAQGNRTITARAGDNIGGSYHLDAITEDTLDMTYLPLGIKQTLVIVRSAP
ncbi:MAG: hypothetical protein HY849_07640 [Nitrosomonadales bacterium]|nr:hypothetical protein [Nitrosomonadales bacterium]